MKEEIDAVGCGRGNDLIAFLYGELDSTETAIFRNHMRHCPACSAECAGFSDIRESVVAWRNEALTGTASGVVQPSTAARVKPVKPSALAALREFLNLSPVWMKGALVFASCLFCLFAVMAIARFREDPKQPVAINPNQKAYSNQELNEIVEQRVRDEIKRIKDSSETAPISPVIANGFDNVPQRRNRSHDVVPVSRQAKGQRPLSKVERQELAADLRLISDPTERELDLLDDRLNR